MSSSQKRHDKSFTRPLVQQRRKKHTLSRRSNTRTLRDEYLFKKMRQNDINKERRCLCLCLLCLLRLLCLLPPPPRVFRSCVFVVSVRERDINRSCMRESSSFLGVWSLFSFVCKKMKNGTSFFLHSFVDVGVKKDIRRERGTNLI